MASKSAAARTGRPSPTRKRCCSTAKGRPGKLEVVATKPMATQRDLSLAYSPGVAVPVLAIAEDPTRAYDYTTKGNFVAVITNGTAILGLGNLGALAAKPVMEGKAVCSSALPMSIPSILRSRPRIRTTSSIASATRPELRRHQSRGHQGAGVLHHRAAAARAARHSRCSMTISTVRPSSPQPA